MRAATPGPDHGRLGGQTRMETNVKAIELRELWRRYKTEGDQRARERLVVAYSPLVKYVAGRTAAGLPPHVEEADLISYGLVGLISAIERFDLVAGDQVRDVRDHAHQGRDHRRAALDGLGAAQRARPRPRSRARERQARERAAAGADRQGDGGRAEDHGRRTERVAAGDLALLDGRAGRAVEHIGLQRRPGLADGHDRGSDGARPARRRSTWAT